MLLINNFLKTQIQTNIKKSETKTRSEIYFLKGFE